MPTRASLAFGLARSPSAHRRPVLPYGSELALAGKKTVLFKTLLTLCGIVLALRDDTSMLVHKEIGLLESWSPICLVRSAVPHLSARTAEKCVFLPVDVVHAV